MKTPADLKKKIEAFVLIGTALSAEHDLSSLLEMIVDAARSFTNADAGTLYMVQDRDKTLSFAIAQNDTLGIRTGGKTGGPLNLPPVPLEVDGRPNLSHVSAFVANTGEIVNIPDVYEAEGFDFTGPRRYDATTGYRSRSMLVLPLRNHENDIIGVLQLLNAKDSNGDVIPFEEEMVPLTGALAAQAAIALTNALLINNLEELLESFIRTIAAAIDEKSPFTAGHIRRVAELTVEMAKKINESEEGFYADKSFSEKELYELRIAAWLHDIGKITTPEYIIDKANKLEGIFDRIELVRLRFRLLIFELEKKALKEKLKLYRNNAAAPGRLAEIAAKLKKGKEKLNKELEFVEFVNTAKGFLQDDDLKRLEKTAKLKYAFEGGKTPVITEDELENLSVRKGNLNAGERKIIENHARLTYRMLSELPYPKDLKHVPEYAGAHHERLDGSGYPGGLKEDQIPIQARLLAIADVFEALTAPDRPYKKPMSFEQALKILGFMAKDRHIDGNLLEFLNNSGIFQEYMDKEVNPKEKKKETQAAG
ncbi:MAG: HD domain-containing protein [Chloroflexi bacterium]|nr:HD domain-containing protein [Chloroflexota bacterium]